MCTNAKSFYISFCVNKCILDASHSPNHERTLEASNLHAVISDIFDLGLPREPRSARRKPTLK